MTSINQYRRTVRDYLQQGYGIEPILRVDGKHSRYNFDYEGKSVTIILNDRNGAGGSNAVELKLQDIRRELGEPTWPKVDSKSTTLAVMTQQLNTAAEKLVAPPQQESTVPTLDIPKTIIGSVSLYPSNSMLCIRVPTEICLAYAYTGACKVDFTYPGTFVIRKATTGAKIQVDRGLTVGGSGIRKRLGSFVATPAAFKIVNNTIEVRLTEKPGHVFTPQPEPIDEPATDPALQPDKQTKLRWRENPMFAALRLINEIETTTDYRLHSTEGNGKRRWVFRAPDIGLE